ncbi:MAG: type II toxin-antitoxin system RelE/ParE family toxin [Verrucomicrobia bacterium]|nr:type II toxin-antitoxin system RelE/ParE family toxin [Verrucomicrobiota bacterium]
MKIAYTLLARNDLAKIYRWYQSHGGVELAERFLQAADKAFQEIARNPEIGRRRNLQSRRLGEVRSLAVSKPFSVYLTFYRREPDEILILRVLQGMRDLPPLLEGGA